MTFIPWSPDEDERLRKLALSGASLGEIAKQMQRTKSSVRTRALKLKIAIAREETRCKRESVRYRALTGRIRQL